MNRLKIGFMLLFFLFSIAEGFSQSDRKEKKKLDRIERKTIERAEDQKRLESLESLIKDQTFVIEAYALRGKYSPQYQVSPNTNFIMVEGDKLVLQTAGGFYPGYNGLGGITINGNIIDYDISNSGENNISLMINFVSTVLGHSTLNISMNADGYATAFVTDSRGGRATFRGEVDALENSSVYEGMSIL